MSIRALSAAATLFGIIGITAPAIAGPNLPHLPNLPVPPLPPPIIVPPPVPPPVVVAPPPPVYVEPPPPVYIDETDYYFDDPPRLIWAPSLGYYVAVGIPQEIVFVNNRYYLHRHGKWYRSSHYNGPWVSTYRKHLPPSLRRHDWSHIRQHRDREYRIYQRDPRHYRGRFHEHRVEHRRGSHDRPRIDHRRDDHGRDRIEHRGRHSGHRDDVRRETRPSERRDGQRHEDRHDRDHR